MRTPEHLRNRNIPRGIQGGIRRRAPPIQRTILGQGQVILKGWPSRGGVIELCRASAVDFEFVGLDPVHPAIQRDRDQEAEDRFCQRLLMLGAKWFDSRERCGFIHLVQEDVEPAINALESGEETEPSTMERRWVSVAYPTAPSGGLWVLEFDTVMHGMRERDNLLPHDAARVTLARTMDERCEILKIMGGRFFAGVELYDGAACLRAWEEKTQGELGPLVQTWYEEE